MFKRGLKNSLQYFILAVAAFGCAPSVAPITNEPLVYPAPPEDPRIVYLTSYYGEGDFKKRSWFDNFFGTPPVPPMKKPYGVSAQGERIYVTTELGPVMVIDTKERKVSYIGDKGRAKLGLPIGLAISTEGTVFVSDARFKKIYGFDAQGALKTAIGKTGELLNPVGLAINRELGRLYIVDSHAHMVRVYSTRGEPLFQFGSAGGGDGQFYYPSNVAVNQKNGKVFVADSMNFRVQVFDKDGKFLTKFGQVGDSPGSFTRPRGVAIDSEGHVYVVDAAFGNFQIFDEDGQLLLVVGEGGREPGYFDMPAGIYVDEQDRIFAVDSLNSRVQVFQYLSEKWKKEHPTEYNKYLLPDLQKAADSTPK